MHGEIRVALARTHLAVGERRVADHLSINGLFFPERERPQRLREHLGTLHANRHLTRARPEQRPADANDIAEVEALEQRILIVAEQVLLEVELDASARVGQVRECRLPVRAPRDEPARDTHRRPLLGVAKKLLHFGGSMRGIERVGEGRDAARDERVELLPSRLHHEVDVLGRRRRFTAHGLAHAPAPAFAAPICLRNASMNGSIAPSMTFWTSVSFSSVRWSFTMVYGWKT